MKELKENDLIAADMCSLSFFLEKGKPLHVGVGITNPITVFSFMCPPP
jgi:hypothetical protein